MSDYKLFTSEEFLWSLRYRTLLIEDSRLLVIGSWVGSLLKLHHSIVLEHKMTLWYNQY